MTQALKELVDLVAAETGALTATDADDDSVGWSGDGKPLPMTFGHVRRASADLSALYLPSEHMLLAGEEAYHTAPRDEDGCTKMAAAFKAMLQAAGTPSPSMREVGD